MDRCMGYTYRSYFKYIIFRICLWLKDVTKQIDKSHYTHNTATCWLAALHKTLIQGKVKLYKPAKLSTQAYWKKGLITQNF